ncbi:AI-2E family transporter [Polaromonas sp.]|uniref:AI-2E family transporter n=1 Tax=Polaromonas sp. TaxID=1869339 RepID=UPI001A337AD1|nr:AI-2E family transporter [Burkholderiales bacterium]
MTEEITEEVPVPVPVPPAEAEEEVTAFPEPERLLLQMPVDVRNLSLVVMAILASLFVLQWARAVLIPIMLSVLLSYAFSPLINWLEIRRVPRWLSSAMLLLAILGAMGSGAYRLRLEAAQLIEALPAAAQKLGRALKSGSGKSDSALETVQRAAAQIEQATRESAAVTGPNRGATRVVIEAPRFNIKDYLWTGTVGLLALIGQVTVVVFLTYFLMLSGDTFRRKLVKLAGPSLSKKRVTLQALHEIAGQIQRYLQVQLLTSLLVGTLTGLALLFIGLENAAVWGVVAGVMNLVPYIGSLITAAASALVGFLQFGSINMALAVGGASVVIHTLVGNLLTPWLTSRASRLSPVAVFMGLLAWGWLWGVWGLLLGIPVLMIVKSVCDRVEDLKPIGEFLGS